MIIEELNEELELDKRTYLPFILKTNCKCYNKELIRNLSTDYLSYPTVNSEQTIHFYCEECDVSIKEKVKFTVKLEQI